MIKKIRLNKMIEYTYRKAVPRFIKEKISILFNPSYTLSINPGDRVQNYFNACKKILRHTCCKRNK